MKFLSGSLDKLVEALKTKAKTPNCEKCLELERIADENDEIGDNNGGDGGGRAEPGLIPECDECRDKPEVRKVFPRTYDYVTSTFGEEHLAALLRKQVYRNKTTTMSDSVFSFNHHLLFLFFRYTVTITSTRIRDSRKLDCRPRNISSTRSPTRPSRLRNTNTPRIFGKISSSRLCLSSAPCT